MAAEQAERERLADKLAQVLDHVYASSALPATAGGETGPLPHIPGQRPQSRRIPKDKRWLWPVPGVLAAAGVGLKNGLRVKTATTGLAMSGMATVTVLSLAHAHTAEYDRTIYVPPGSSVPSRSDPGAAARVILPVSRLSSNPKPLVHVTRRAFVRPPFIAAPRPVPVPVPVPAVTPPPQPQDTPGSDSSSQPSQSPQPSDYRSHGGHASQWSDPGRGGYEPRHGHNDSGSNYWQDGSQQNGGSQQNDGQQQGNGGNWQGSQQQGGQDSSPAGPATATAPADVPTTDAPAMASAPQVTGTATAPAPAPSAS